MSQKAEPSTPAGPGIRQTLGVLLETLTALQATATPGQRTLLDQAQRLLESTCARLPTAVLEPGPGSSPDPDGPRPVVLVVEDDDSTRELMSELLRDQFDVRLACDPTAALAIAEEAHPDVIVTDLVMPGGGGMSLLDWLRADEELQHIPVIVLSGLINMSTKIRAFDAGAFDFITKPLQADELLARVGNAARRGQSLKREMTLKDTDELTGLANRRSLRRVAATALEESNRSGRNLTVVMVDSDGLKQINDVHGHAAGDEAIRTLARALSHCKRGSDCAARLGGDEFGVLMPCTGRDGALAFIARVHEQLAANPLKLGAALVPVRASFGIACYPETAWPETREELFKRADEALYEEKRSRKLELLAVG